MAMFIFGILFWSLLHTVYEAIPITPHDPDLENLIFGGPVYWAVALVCAIIRKWREFIRHKNGRRSKKNPVEKI